VDLIAIDAHLFNVSSFSEDRPMSRASASSQQTRVIHAPAIEWLLLSGDFAHIFALCYRYHDL
jgi:hypothetical protein